MYSDQVAVKIDTPDLTQDRELVELANVLREAHLSKMAVWGHPVALYSGEYLAMADAARTHLGSGYVLPPATEANAERLRDAYRYQQNLRLPIRDALYWLEALHAAFATREPKEDGNGLWIEPKDDVTKALNAEEQDSITGCDPTDCDICQAEEERRAAERRAKAAEKPVRDAVSRDEQREYEALVLQFAAAMAGDDSAEHVINLAVELADQYLEWRKMEREEFKRCKS